MAKSNGNMYKYIDETFNPLGGKCYHNCTYCSTNKLKRFPVIQEKYSGEPRLYRKELNKKLKKDTLYFVCAQQDLFADINKPFIIQEILNKVMNYKTFFQTKNPAKLYGWLDCISKDAIVCTTIETNRWYPEIMNNCPRPEERAVYMAKIDRVKYVTVEPIIDFDLDEMVTLIRMCKPEQVNIGANTSSVKLPEPSSEKIGELIEELEQFTKVKLKSNLKRLYHAKKCD